MTPDTDQTGPSAEAIAEALNHCREAAAIDPTEPHYFKFSKNWSDGRCGGRRLCGACGLNYDEGAHIEITTLKPFTHYVCPTGGGGLGHSAIYTGSMEYPEMRGVRDHICICGTEFVEEDNEQWEISFEMQSPGSTHWHPVSNVISKHAANTQHQGLLDLIDRGEPIRKVKLRRLPTEEDVENELRSLRKRVKRLRKACRKASKDDWGLEYLYVSTIDGILDGKRNA